MIEAVIIALAAVVIAFMWHVHKTLERLESVYALMLNVMNTHMESVYNLAHYNLEQYAAAMQYPQSDDAGRYA